ncbi:MAG: hypothetical protein GW778_04825 [Alphaproteobacteria bacterium]|nr:hypothetical protein [Alphaproteobacteria bacterium]
MKHKTLLLAAMAALPMLALSPTQAEARLDQRCKTYTKTIKENGRKKYASGRACQRDNGLWEIVNINAGYLTRTQMAEHIYDSLYRQGYSVLINDYYVPAPRGTYAWHNAYARYTPHPTYRAGYNNGWNGTRYKKHQNKHNDHRNHHDHEKDRRGHR